jgi:hypothetical protein
MARRFETLTPEEQAERERLAIMARRQYHNEWRRKNKDRVREYNMRMFYKKALRRMEAEKQAESNGGAE